jgi:hypothetical protein
MSLIGDLKRRFLNGFPMDLPRERRESRGPDTGETGDPGGIEGSGIRRHAFLAVVEALQDDADAVPASSEVGRNLADDGVSLLEALDGLHAAYAAVTGTEPDFDAVRALSQSWSETSLTYLHSLSCDDPLTGLSSMPHLRSRLNEIYRDAEFTARSVSATHALVVVEAPVGPGGTTVDRELRLVDVAECLRIVYCGGETLGRIGSTRAAALVTRDAGLPEQVETVRALMSAWHHEEDEFDEFPIARVWIERLPASVEWAGRLLDELAR